MIQVIAKQGYKQQGLFSPTIPVKEDKPLIVALNKINDKWGRSTIQYGMTEDEDRPWSVQQTRKSPAYTTNWSELPVVKATT